MNDATIQFLNASARKDGFTRGSVDPGVNTIYSSAGIRLLPVGMDIDRDEANDVRVQTNEFLAENAGVDEIIAIEESANIDETANNHDESDQESAPFTDSERDGPLYPAEDLIHESPAPSIVGDTPIGRQYSTRLAAGAIHIAESYRANMTLCFMKKMRMLEERFVASSQSESTGEIQSLRSQSL